MQRKYIDYTDFEHLSNTLSQDIKPLYNRLKKIEQGLKRTFGTIKQRSDGNHEIWKSPLSKNLWSIYYIYSFYNHKVEVDFFPFTEFSSSRGEKEFLLIRKIDKIKFLNNKLTTLSKINDSSDKNTFKEYLEKNNLFLIIYRGHFIDRFRMRTAKSDYTIFGTIMAFNINPNLVLVDNFQQKHDWLMYMQSEGVAMIRLENNYMVFDTFIAMHELKDSQITAIKNHLKSMSNRNYGAIAFLLLDNDAWMEYFDEDRLLNFLENLTRIDRQAAKSLVDLNLPIIAKLFGQSFVDDYLADVEFWKKEMYKH